MIQLPPAANAKLPAVYEQAKDALAACSRIDECATWANKAEAIASYARQADDETLLNTATRIKARAIRRCGELLREVKPASGGRPVRGAASTPSKTRGGAPPSFSRARVAKEAGLSVDQRKQAMRVAAVPKADFERAVESPKPPTVTELAARGKKPSTSHLQGRDPVDFQKSTRAQAALKEFAAVASEIDPATTIRGALPHEISKMRSNAEKAAAWITDLQTQLERVGR